MTFTERQGKFSLLNLWLVKCGTVVVWFLKFEHETGSPFTTLPGALPNLSFPFFPAPSQCPPPPPPLLRLYSNHFLLVPPLIEGVYVINKGGSSLTKVAWLQGLIGKLGGFNLLP